MCAAVGLLFALKAAKDRANDSPSEVEPGSEFTHDGFVAEDGWEVVEERGDFDIVDLVVKNRRIAHRDAFFEFTIFRDGDVVGYVSCSKAFGARDEAEMDCFSADEYVDDFDEVRVADTF